MKKASINSSDFQKYFKQFMLKKIGISGQKKILNSKVLIVGAGGLGCPLILYLAYSGVGNLGIVDHDKIEISNLSRQILFTKKDIGKYKTLVSKNAAKRINNKIRIDVFTEKLNHKNINKIAKKYPIICDGTDNFKTRLLINDYCLSNKKILVSSAISKFDSQLFYFDFRKKTPCFRCFMPEIPEQDNNCEAEGIMTPVAGVAGSLQANEVIKSILNIKSNSNGNIILFDALKSSFRKIKLLKDPGCINRHIHG